jgi:hypothetical protein
VFVFASSDYATIKKQGVDYSFEKIDSLRVNDKNYVLYRTNGGATTAYGLVLRSEKEFISGINVVRAIYNKYKASESSLTLLGGKQTEMEIQPHGIDVVTIDL